MKSLEDRLRDVEKQLKKTDSNAASIFFVVFIWLLILSVMR